MLKIPVAEPLRAIEAERAEIDLAISRVLDSGFLVLGPENEALAFELSTYLSVSNTVLVGNGTDAIEIGLTVLGVGPGDNVVTVANAGGYALATIRTLCANPVYVDIDPASLQMSVSSLREVLERTYPTPKVVVVTHLFGQAAEITEIMEVAKQFGALVLEDCAQSLGAKVDEKHVGTFGAVSTTSFYPTKNLGGLGDGGALFTNSEEFAAKARSLRQYGWSDKYRIEISGGRNSRLDEIQAAILRLRLGKLDERNNLRRDIHSSYRSSSDAMGYFPHDATESFVGHLAVMLVGSRRKAIDHFEKHMIGTAIHYPIPDHQQPAFPESSAAKLPVTEEIAEKILTVPLFPELTLEEVSRIKESLNAF